MSLTAFFPGAISCRRNFPFGYYVRNFLSIPYLFEHMVQVSYTGNMTWY